MVLDPRNQINSLRPPRSPARGGAQIAVVGLNHETAPIALRERFAFSSNRVPEVARALAVEHRLPECVLLSTCNRTEIYGAAETIDPWAVLESLSRSQGVDAGELRTHSYAYHGPEAARHLCEVAAGLDSMVLGEQQILGQVKDAAELAAAAQIDGPILAATFRAAITAGKRARTETRISRGAVSVSHAAVELSRQIFGELSGCRALLLGAGEMSEITLKLLRDAGMKTSVMVSSRTRERAQDLADRCGGVGVEWDRFPSALVDADIVMVSTSAPHYIVRTDTVRQAMKDRRGRRIFIVDISVPRNVDPEAGLLPDVFLYNIDDLQGVVAENLGERSREREKVEVIIQDELDRLTQWLNGRSVVDAIVGLRDHAETVRQEEWDRFGARLAHLSEKDLRTVEALTRQLMLRVMRDPLERLKELGSEGPGFDRAEVVRELFLPRGDDDKAPETQGSQPLPVKASVEDGR